MRLSGAALAGTIALKTMQFAIRITQRITGRPRTCARITSSHLYLDCKASFGRQPSVAVLGIRPA
jgi:hypothetical protein